MTPSKVDLRLPELRQAEMTVPGYCLAGMITEATGAYPALRFRLQYGLLLCLFRG
jgi:hypothetical protein